MLARLLPGKASSLVVFLALFLAGYAQQAAAYLTVTPSKSTTGDLTVKVDPYSGSCSGDCVNQWTTLTVSHNGKSLGSVYGHSQATSLGNGTYAFKATSVGTWTFRYTHHRRYGRERYPCGGVPYFDLGSTPVDGGAVSPLAAAAGYGQACYAYYETTTSVIASRAATVASPVGKPAFNNLPSELDAAGGKYTIGWGKPSGTVKRYKLEEKINGGAFKAVSLSNPLALSYTPSAQPQGNTYYYRVQGCNDLECGAWSDTATVKVRTNEAPTVTWVESPHGKSYRPDQLPTLYVRATDFNGIREVKFYRDNGAGSEKFLLGTAIPDNGKCSGCFRANWTSSPLSASVKIWAEAKDDLKDAPPMTGSSSKASVSVLANKAPTGFLVSPPGSIQQYQTVTLKANASDSDGSVKSVEFLLDNSSLGTDTTAPYEKSWTPQNAGSFQLKVRITDNEGLSAVSNAFPVTVVALQPPAAPSQLTIDNQPQPIPDNTSGNYTLGWNAVADADSYKLEQLQVGVDTQFKALTLANAKVPGHYLPDQGEGRYRYRAYACNKAGCSAPSAEIAVNVVKKAPVAPASLSVSADPKWSQIFPSGYSALPDVYSGRYSLQWGAVPAGSAPHHYRVQEKTGAPEVPGNWVTVVNSTSATSYQPAGHKQPGSYSYRVLACNAAGCSAPGPLRLVTVFPPVLTAATLACGDSCLRLNGHALDPDAKITLTAVHNPGIKQTFASNALSWRSTLEVEVPVQKGTPLHQALFELGLRATVENPNGTRGDITVYGDRATEIIGESQSGPALGPDGALYVGAGDKLYALDTADGSIKPAWPFTIPSGGLIKATPRVDGLDGTVYVGSLDHSLYAVTPHAIQKWRLETDGKIVSSVVLDEERVLYFGSMDGVLYAVNAESGRRKWTFPTEAGIAEPPVLAGDNTLYFTNVGGPQIYAISRDSAGPGKLVWESVEDALIREEIGDWQPDPSQRAEYLSIARLYRGLLQPPLPFSERIVTFWTYQLLGGQANLVQTAQAFLESETGHGNFPPNQSDSAFVDALYARIFPNQGQPLLTFGGLTYSRAKLLELLANGHTRAQIAMLFTQSLEYTAATSALLGHSFDYLYNQDYDWAITDCNEGDAYTRDCDGDGLPDWWEILIFGTTEYGAQDDPDGDGITNEEAYWGKVNPCIAGCYNGITEEPPAPAAAPQIDPAELRASAITGALPGEFRVNEAGAATYSMPLSLPAGTAGVAPELRLNYASRGGNGLLGQGWSLGGLSAISRCRKTPGQDRESAAITWDANDRYCLDGQRLLLVGGGQYGAPGSQYRTEVDSYLLVTARGGSLGKPEYFTVERKDGSISYYGRNSDDNRARQQVTGGHTLTWAVSRYEDSAGNGIDFVYAGDSASDGSGHRIDEVRYAYGAESTPAAVVSFDYEDRPDPIRGYLAGASLGSDQRLTAIEILAGNTLLRRYELDYLETGYDSLSRLERVRECAGSECRPDTVFEWRLPAIHFTPSPSRSLQLSSQRDRAAITPRPVDINGDGRLDLIWLEPDWDNDGKIHDQYFKYVLATDDGFGPEQLAYSDSANMRNPYRWEMLDINADGRADLAIYLKDQGHWKIFPAATAFYADDWFIPVGGIDTPITDEHARFVDINGDGLVDAVTATGYRLLERVTQDDGSSRAYRFGDEKPWQLQGFADWEPLDGTWESHARYLHPEVAGDFDGDGRVDLVVMDTRQTWELDGLRLKLKEQHTRATVARVQGNQLIAGDVLLDFVQREGFKKKNRDPDASPQDRHGDLQQKLLAADLNQDGLTDLLLGDGDTYHYRLNTGAGFASPVALGSFPKDARFSWFDYEGDGDLDLVWRDDNDVLKVRRWHSDRQAFADQAETVRTGRKGGQDLFVDMNGDGSTDYLEFHDDYLYLHHSPDRQVAPNVIEKITNGLGAETRIAYGSSTRSGHYARLGIANVQGGNCWQAGVSTFATGADNWCRQYHKEDTRDFYTTLNQDWNGSHSLGKAGPVLEQIGTHFLVTRVESSAPAANDQPEQVSHNATSAIRYYYGRALIQAGGRGPLGFERIRTVDEQSGIETTTSYRQDFPFLGHPLSTEVRSAEGHLLSEAKNTWRLRGWQSTWPETAKTQGSAALGPLKPYLAESEENVYELRDNGQAQGQLLRTVTSVTEQDDHGNPTILTVATVAANGDTFSTRTVNTYGSGSVSFQNSEHRFNGYRELGRLSATTVTHSRTQGGESVSAVRKSDFSYYDSGKEAGLLKEEIVESSATDPVNGSLRLSTRYEYDRSGNKTLAEQSAESEAPRTTRWHYDARGRFVEREENAYGQTTSQVLERNAHGQPTLVQDMAGVQSAIRYDIFGRKVLEYSATGAHKLSLFAPAGAQCPAGSVYQHSERSGDGGEQITCFDKLARKVRQAVRAFDGGWNYADTEYDTLGRVKHQSEPYKADGARYWSTQSYDRTGRLIGTDLPGVQGSNGTAYDIAITYDGHTTVTTNPKGQVHRETFNAQGEKVRVQDNLGNVQEFQHDAQGNLVKVINKGDGSRNLVTEIHYDLRGRKTQMSDPDKGEWHYVHNGYGDLTEQIDAKGQKVVNTYDTLGRLQRRIDYRADGSVEADTQWHYNNTSGWQNSVAPGALERVEESQSGYLKVHTYDALGRPSETATSFGEGDNHYEKTNYDQYSRPFQVFDAGGDGSWESSAIRHHYNQYGYLEQVTDAEQVNLATGEHFYTVLKMDARGNVTESLNGNGVTTEKVYDPATGRLQRQTAHVLGLENIQGLTYHWDSLGNLEYREDRSGGKNLREDFEYDALNRLTKSQVQGRAAQTLQYNDLGNITYKSDVGDYKYGDDCPATPKAGPHAVCATEDANGQVTAYHYDANGNMESDGTGRSLKYSTFDKPTEIKKNGHTTAFQYGPDRSRYLRIDTDSSGKRTETRSIGNVEKITSPDGSTSIKRYLPGGALVTITSGKRESRYLHKDHLGSIDVITDKMGKVELALSFDAWGQRRNVDSWETLIQNLSQSQLSQYSLITTRGYTGHEMLDQVGLIHMNGRIYDPRLARFLQADPFVQEPGYSQSHNRYAYVWNNPLNATDPSGYFVFTLGAMIYLAAAKISTWYVVGAVMGAAGFLDALSQGASVQDAFRSGLIAGVSAAAFAGIGNHLGANPNYSGSFAGNLNATGYGLKIAAHGITGGVMSVLQGGKFGHGFAAAGFVSMASGGIGKINNPVGRVAASAIVGGTASKLTGGKFANGAATGAFQAAVAEVASGNGNRPGFTEGGVEVDYSQLQTEGDYQLVADHLHSLVGDSSVNQTSLGLASMGVGFHYTQARLSASLVTSSDVANGIMHRRLYESQRQVAIFGAGVAALPGVATGIGYSAYTWASLPPHIRHELIAMGLDVAVEMFVPNGKLDTSAGQRIKYEYVQPVRPRRVPAIIPRP